MAIIGDSNLTTISVKSSLNYPYWTETTSNFDWTPTYMWTSTVYLYQIFCPKKSCKTVNWLKLEEITPCTNCGAKLKAVEETPDYTVKVRK